MWVSLSCNFIKLVRHCQGQSYNLFLKCANIFVHNILFFYALAMCETLFFTTFANE